MAIYVAQYARMNRNQIFGKSSKTKQKKKKKKNKKKIKKKIKKKKIIRRRLATPAPSQPGAQINNITIKIMS